MADAHLCPQIRYIKLPTAPVAMTDRQKTFGDAATSYIQHVAQSKYLPRLVEEIGDISLAAISPFDVEQLAIRLYPDAKNSTRNRSVITPLRAVFHHAHKRLWCPLVRFQSFREETPVRKKPASQAWIHAFVRQCEKDSLLHLAALVLFMSQTGTRISEAISVRWEDVDLVGRTVLLIKTKTEKNSTRFLTDQLVARMHALKGNKRTVARVFGYIDRDSVNERIKAVCKRAELTYKPTHTCGRHAFATNSLELGNDVKSTMLAGGWTSPVIFLNVYVNPRNAGRQVAERFNLYQYDSDL